MKKITSLILILLTISNVVSYADVTKFSEIKPKVITLQNYSKKTVRGVKNYIVPFSDSIRYYVFCSLYGAVIIDFPYKIVDDAFSGTPEYIDIKKSKNEKSLKVRVKLPDSSPEDLKTDPSEIEGVLSMPIHIELEGGKRAWLRFEISSQKDENERIRVFDTDKEAQLKDQASLPYLKNEIEQKDNELFINYKREKNLHFNNFKVHKVDISKKIKDTTLTLLTISSTDEYLYYNFKVDGKYLAPLRTKDFILKVQNYGKALIFEKKETEITYHAERLVVYPESATTMPDQNIIPSKGSQQHFTVVFKISSKNDVFNSKLSVKTNEVEYINRVDFKKIEYHSFMSDMRG